MGEGTEETLRWSEDTQVGGRKAAEPVKVEKLTRVCPCLPRRGG